jgi:hypothetical protein
MGAGTDVAFSHLLSDDICLLLRKQFGINLNNAKMIGYGFCSSSGVTCQQNDFGFHFLEGLDRCNSAWAQLICD